MPEPDPIKDVEIAALTGKISDLPPDEQVNFLLGFAQKVLDSRARLSEQYLARSALLLRATTALGELGPTTEESLPDAVAELVAERDRLQRRVEVERRHRMRAIDEEVRALSERDRLQEFIDAGNDGQAKLVSDYVAERKHLWAVAVAARGLLAQVDDCPAANLTLAIAEACDELAGALSAAGEPS